MKSVAEKKDEKAMISFKKVTCVNSVLTGHLLEAT
jgi:hypothetical protein